MKVKTICCIGAGYVGGPTMAVIAQQCPHLMVLVVDQNLERIAAWNSKDLTQLPVYEPGLSEVIATTRDKNLFFSTNIDEAIKKAEMIFMAVNTPTKTSGEGKGMAADLSHVENCAHRIAQIATTNKIVVEKSTLPVRTAEKIKEVLSTNKIGLSFEVLSNPEFLAEGTAIKDLFKSDRVLIGGDSTPTGQDAVAALVSIYLNWIPKEKILTTNVWSSELSKLASNAILAQRISSINSLSALCEKTGASIQEVSRAVGLDHRIGDKFLNASVGFGGSCFQKDVLNLVYLCQTYGLTEVGEYWHQVIKINDYQKNRFATLMAEYLITHNLPKNISLLGWAFKKNTNDSRESAAIYVAAQLLEKDHSLWVYDPMVKETRIHADLTLLFESQNKNKEQVKKLLANIKVCASITDALSPANVAGILTEWDEFKVFDWKNFLDNSDKNYRLFDGRNLINQQISNKIFSIGN